MVDHKRHRRAGQVDGLMPFLEVPELAALFRQSRLAPIGDPAVRAGDAGDIVPTARLAHPSPVPVICRELGNLVTRSRE